MDKDKHNFKSLRVTNKLENLETISVYLDALALEWQIPMPVTMTLNLVIEEAFTNVVNYAYVDEHVHHIEINFQKDSNILNIIIIDDGEPYDPTKNADPDITLPAEERAVGGLGIFLIRSMMDNVEYKRVDNKNVLVMRKGIRSPDTNDGNSK